MRQLLTLGYGCRCAHKIVQNSELFFCFPFVTAVWSYFIYSENCILVVFHKRKKKHTRSVRIAPTTFDVSFMLPFYVFAAAHFSNSAHFFSVWIQRFEIVFITSGVEYIFSWSCPIVVYFFQTRFLFCVAESPFATQFPSNFFFCCWNN